MDKSELWMGASNAAEARALPQLTKQSAIDWVASNYIVNTKDQVNRESIIVIHGLGSKPSVEKLSGLTGNYEEPVIDYDAETKTTTVTINNNGYIDFDLVVKDDVVVPIDSETIPTKP